MKIKKQLKDVTRERERPNEKERNEPSKMKKQDEKGKECGEKEIVMRSKRKKIEKLKIE